MSEPNLSFGKNVPQPKRALLPNIGIPSHKFTYDVADQLYDEKNKVGHTHTHAIPVTRQSLTGCWLFWCCYGPPQSWRPVRTRGAGRC